MEMEVILYVLDKRCSENRGFARTVDCFSYLSKYLLISTLKALSTFPQPRLQPLRLALCKLIKNIGITPGGAKRLVEEMNGLRNNIANCPPSRYKVCNRNTLIL